MENALKFLDESGIKLKKIHDNLPVSALIEDAIKADKALLGHEGELSVKTGVFTGRSPKDKFIVKESSSQDHIDWGNINQPIDEKAFDEIWSHVKGFLQEKSLYLFEGFCGHDKKQRLNVRFFTLKAWHAHFVNNMFIPAKTEERKDFLADFTIINACGYSEIDFKSYGLNSEVFVLFHMEKKIAIIGGTEYSGEMKKGIFSVMNYLLPFKQILPMHCSANQGHSGDTALFFGLSGTGKTTLSTDPNRQLIGDDEHGWSDDGVFNFENGCYAKTINLSKEKEPDIWKAIRYGAVLENVPHDSMRVPDYKDSSLTENTRVSYPISHIDNVEISGCGTHPKNVIFLSCDAFGVLPPVARLNEEQAAYHFLAGYTAKVAGTERGVTEPQAVFSACFGAPFMMRRPEVYGDLLIEKIRAHGSRVYLVNTGWFGGGYGKGNRMDITLTRHIIDAILSGQMDSLTYQKDPVFQYEVPTQLPGVNVSIDQATSWGDQTAYDTKRIELATLFIQNAQDMPSLVKNPHILQGGPVIR